MCLDIAFLSAPRARRASPMRTTPCKRRAGSQVAAVYTVSSKLRKLMHDERHLSEVQAGALPELF